VLDFDGDLYGHRVAVDFTHHLRDQATFAGLEELIAQIKADIVKARQLLGQAGDGGRSRAARDER
jgi:riboflavin kinase/FMN adenylyltransferase